MNNTSQDTRERIGVRNSHNIISIIFLSLVALLALSFSVMLLIKNASLKREEEAVRSELEALNEEGYYTLTEADKLIENAKEETRVETTNSIKEKIQEKLEAGEGTTSTIRSLFPDQMVVASSGRYYFFPILDSIAHHGFSEEDFEVGEDGFLEYVGEDGSVNVRKGVDVSRFQGKIDWDKVADAGIDFAFIRVGLRGTTEGKILVDDCFEDNIKGATASGIDVGVYFYSQAVNEEEALDEQVAAVDDQQNGHGCEKSEHQVGQDAVGISGCHDLVPLFIARISRCHTDQHALAGSNRSRTAHPRGLAVQGRIRQSPIGTIELGVT